MQTTEAVETPRSIVTRPPGKIWTYVAAALFAAFFLVTSLQIAAHRPFWFDEIETVIFSRLSGPSKIIEALSQADNNMPALYFLVVHWFERLLPQSELVPRLPSALAMAAGLLITFDCARRLADGLHGLIAMSVLACSFLPYYGYEARSYAIYFMLSALGLWAWLFVKGKWTSAVLFGAVLFLNTMFHYYAVLCLVPYMAFEASRWKRWRLPSGKLIAGGLAVCCAAAVLLPQMSGAKRYSAIFWSPPAFYKLRGIFSNLFPDGLLLLALILIWIAFTARTAGDARPGFTVTAGEGERIGWLGLLIPFAGYVVARLVTNAYVDRYFMGLLPGVAVAFSVLVWRCFRGTRIVAPGILLILAGSGVATQVQTVRNPQSIDPFGQQTALRQALQMEASLRNEGKRYTLLTNGLLFLEVSYYAKHPEQYVLLVPSPRYLEVSNTARYTFGLRRYQPLTFWNPEDLRSHAGETALIQPGAEGLRLVKEAGVEATVRFTAPMEVDYLR